MTHIECIGKKSSEKPENEKKLLSRCAPQVLGGLFSHMSGLHKTEHIPVKIPWYPAWEMVNKEKARL